MRSNVKFKLTIIMIIEIVLFLFCVFYINPYCKTGINSKNIRSSYILSATSGVVHIDNNWTYTEGNYSWCSGSGTYSEPYVIEDLKIDGSGLGACILIENSNVYFRIENCTVFNSGNHSFGINLFNVNNSQITNNTCLTYEKGICLLYSYNNTISENTAFNITDSDGIYLYHSDSNIISKNNASYNHISGISLDNSKSNIISRNTLNYNSEGIQLSFSFDNSITGNIVNDNACGIRLGYSYYNTISENIGEYNYNCMFLFKSDNNIISGNTLNNNLNGIGLYYSDDNTLSKNTANYNEINGIDLSYSNNNILSGNTAKDNDECGIYLFLSNKNKISGNVLTGNVICIKEIGCKRNLFFNNGLCTYRDTLIIILLVPSIIGVGAVLGFLTNSLLKSKRKTNQ